MSKVNIFLFIVLILSFGKYGYDTYQEKEKIEEMRPKCFKSGSYVDFQFYSNDQVYTVLVREKEVVAFGIFNYKLSHDEEISCPKINKMTDRVYDYLNYRNLNKDFKTEATKVGLI